jgi:hypothetical protein
LIFGAIRAFETSSGPIADAMVQAGKSWSPKQGRMQFPESCSYFDHSNFGFLITGEAPHDAGKVII